MALLYNYPDEYLSKRVTEDREQRAKDEVALTGIEDPSYIEKLTILKTYIITSLECNSNPDDIFAQKLKTYSKEYESLLTTAKNAKLSVDGDSVYSINVERS